MICSSENRFCFIRPPRHRPDSSSNWRKQRGSRHNQSEAITGLVLWDNGDFFQWLEGPEDGVARVMRSINADTRHTDVEILTWEKTARRRFADWDMKLGLVGDASIPWACEVLALSPGSLALLRRHPQDAGRVFDRLATKRFSPALEYVVYNEVIPRLGQTGLAPCRGRQLANLLRSGDVKSILRFSRSLRLCRVGLLELTARLLGDDWMEDRCSEAEVTLAFCTLQKVLRLLHRPARVRGEWAGSALVAPQPGELHGLCASMSAHALRAEGWAVRCEFPDNDGMLTLLLETSWFDLLDLSLSAAFTRSDRLEALAATIRRARSASLQSCARGGCRRACFCGGSGSRCSSRRRLAGRRSGGCGRADYAPCRTERHPRRDEHCQHSHNIPPKHLNQQYGSERTGEDGRMIVASRNTPS